jgi:hypothetical protein
MRRGERAARVEVASWISCSVASRSVGSVASRSRRAGAPNDQCPGRAARVARDNAEHGRFLYDRFVRGGLPRDVIKHQRADDFMRFAKAFGPLVITIVSILGDFLVNLSEDFLKWTDRHRGSIAALATVAIAILTYGYATYSKLQWQTMQQQMKDSEAAQRASVNLGLPDGRLGEFAFQGADN